MINFSVSMDPLELYDSLIKEHRSNVVSRIINDLPTGTKFYVVNGNWRGKIIKVNGRKYIETEVGPVPARNNDMGLEIIIKSYV